MLERLQEPIRRMLKVPPRPDPPLGAPESLRVFRAAPGFFRYRLLAWGWKQLGTAAGLVFGLYFLGAMDQVDAVSWTPWAWIGRLEWLAIAGFVAQLPLSFLLVALDYRYRWYLTTDRSLRIREGIWKVQERTMTFSNIQNVEIRQGPLQRFFGIADLRVQTAGGGGRQKEAGGESAGDDLHVGHFRGIDNAPEIRDSILARLRRLRDAGLGDPDEAPGDDEPATGQPSERPPVLTAAAELLSEARALSAELVP